MKIKNEIMKKILSLVLCCCMLLSMNAAAFAEGTDPGLDFCDKCGLASHEGSCVCTKAEDCPADNHETDCLSQLCDKCGLANHEDSCVCTKAEACPADTHEADCLKKLAEDAAAEKAAADQAKIDELNALIAALPEEVTAENYEEVMTQLTAIKGRETEMGELWNQLDLVKLDAVILATQALAVIPTCNGTTCDVTGEDGHNANCSKVVATIGDKGYTTVTAAINAAESGATVILKGITISEYIAPWINDPSHACEKSITIQGSAGTVLTGGLYLGYDDSQNRGHVITVTGITFETKGVLVAGQGTVNIKNNTFNNITDYVATSGSSSINAISVIGKDVISTIQSNTINGATSDGINLRNTKSAIVTGNTISNTGDNSITITVGNAESITVSGNNLSDWGTTGNDGRAMRINGGATTITDNVMKCTNTHPEEVAKLSGTTGVDFSGNYWNGEDPADVNVFRSDDAAVPAELIKNYYTDETKSESSKVKLMLDGSGTAEAPYVISTKEELATFASLVNGGNTFSGKVIKLTADIDLENAEWTPIGTSSAHFGGTFYGDDKTISNLKVSSGSYIGLFGKLSGGSIKNIKINNVSINGTEYLGAVVGMGYTGSIDNCHVSGSISITGNYMVGGINGHGYATINGCSVIATGSGLIQGTHDGGSKEGDNVGGIVGHCGETNTLTNNTVKNVTVAGTRKVGGIVGIANMGTNVSGCVLENVIVKTNATQDYANANLKTMSIGGLIGQYQANGSGGAVSGNSVSGLSFVNDNGVTVSAGVLTGGMRGTTEILAPSAAITTGGNAVSSVTGDNNRYLYKAVAQIGSVEYDSLQRAVNDAGSGDTILLIDNIEQADGVIITDKNLTIDLNEKTFTVSEGANTNNRNFKIDGSSVVTIKNGTMVAKGDYSSGAYGTVRTEGTANVTLTGLKLYNYRGNGLNVKACSGTTVTISDTQVYSQYGGGIEAAGGTIELTNVTVDQQGMYTAPYNSMAISVNGGGSVTVNSGTYSSVPLKAEDGNNQGTSHGSWAAGVLNSGGTLTINGGTFANGNVGDDSLATAARGLLLADTGGKIVVNGGTFNALKNIFDIQNNLGDASKQPGASVVGGDFSADPTVAGSNSSFVSIPKGYKVSQNSGRYGIEIDIAQAVAQIGEDYYVTLEDAFKYAESGDTIKLLKNVNIEQTIKIEADDTVTLDLNGNVIDGVDKCNIAIMSYGNFTLKDSSAGQTGAIRAGKTATKSGNAVNICGGTFTMESGSIYSVNNAILIDEEAATVNIEGGKITAEPSTTNSAAIYISSKTETELNISDGTIEGYNGILLWNNTKIEMTGGSIDAKGSVGIQGNGAHDNTEISISGDAKVKGYYAAIYHPQAGKLDISGDAELSGWTGVVVKGGNVSISGGNISGTGEAGTYAPVSSGFIDTGDGLYVEHFDNSSSGYGTPSVSVTGGNFSSTNGKAVASYVNTNNPIEAIGDFISGGTFSDEPSPDTMAPGYKSVKDESTGRYGVEIDVDQMVAKIGDDYYLTLEDALDAAKDGNTLIILKAENGNLAIDGKDLTVVLPETVTNFSMSVKDATVTVSSADLAKLGSVSLDNAAVNNGKTEVGMTAGVVSVNNGTIVATPDVVTDGFAGVTVNGNDILFDNSASASAISVSIDADGNATVPVDGLVEFNGVGSVSATKGAVLKADGSLVQTPAEVEDAGYASVLYTKADGSKTNILVPVNVEGEGTARATLTLKVTDGALADSTDAKEDTIWDDGADFKGYLTISPEKERFYKRGLGKLTFVCNGFMDALAEKNPITMDGVAVDADDVVIKRGSTEVTLQNDYLRSLSLGTHTLQINYADGQSVSAEIKIVNTPITGDNGFGIFAAGLGMSLIGMLGILFMLKKRVKG